METPVLTQPRRPAWRGVALFIAGLSLGSQGFAFGVSMPIALARDGFGGFFTSFPLRVYGVPDGLDLAGTFLPWTLVLLVLTSLGIASIATVVVAAVRQRVLPMAAMAAAWFLLALATVILSGGALDFLASQTMILLLAVAAAWPEMSALTRRG